MGQVLNGFFTSRIKGPVDVQQESTSNGFVCVPKNRSMFKRRESINENTMCWGCRTYQPGVLSHGAFRAIAHSPGLTSTGAQLIARGRVKTKGVVAPEGAFDPLEFIGEPAKRGINVHEEVEESHMVARADKERSRS